MTCVKCEYETMANLCTHDTKIHHQIFTYAIRMLDFGVSLDTSKVPDARRRGERSEAYMTYAAGLRPVGPTPRRGRTIEGNNQDLSLRRQGWHFNTGSGMKIHRHKHLEFLLRSHQLCSNTRIECSDTASLLLKRKKKRIERRLIK